MYVILDHCNYWSVCPFSCCLLFQWFPIWLSIYRGYLATQTIGFDRNQRLL